MSTVIQFVISNKTLVAGFAWAVLNEAMAFSPLKSSSIAQFILSFLAAKKDA